MPRQLVPLTDAQLAIITSAPPDTTPAELARQLGAPYFTVHKAVQRIRRDGWICRLTWQPCLVCGETVVSSTSSGRRLVHPGCKPARHAELARQYRRGPHTPSTAYVRRYRQEHPAETAASREREKAKMREQWPALPAEEQVAMLDHLHQADHRDYPITRDEAVHSGEPWDQDEDAYVLEHLTTSAREVALTLGRTLWAVRNRRVWLRRRAATSL